ncbi:hypothetical protein CSA37_04285 [Candidatus Fermentibacteria bacterium]|nr:MAG: hypothetical protein CSA37_04285 [Candidatus Fermentibacteria bacterium]
MNNTAVGFMYILLRNRKFLLKALLLIMAVTIGVTYLIPKSYTVKTVILPPEEQAPAGLSLGGLSLGDFAGFFSGGMGYSLPLMTTISDVYAEILNSRTLIDNVIISTGYADSLELFEKHEEQPEVAMYLARKNFNKNYEADVTSSGFIEIEVTTDSPYYSVAVSERIVFLLDSINTSITLSRLEESRELTENQFFVAQTALENTTADLLSFEEEYGTIMPEEEIGELIAVLMEMKGRYLEATLTASAIRNGLRYGTNAQVLQLETEAQALGEAIEMIESGSVPGSGFDIGPGLENMPPAVVAYARLKTDFEMNLRMASALELQVIQARIQEENISSSLRILDPPRHPGWKSKPKRLYIWIEVFLVSFILLSAFLFTREKWYELRENDPETWNKWNTLFEEIRRELKFRK